MDAPAADAEARYIITNGGAERMTWCGWRNCSDRAKVAYRWVYDETFDGGERRNGEMMRRFLARDYPRDAVDRRTIVARMRSVDERLAQRIARSGPGEDILAAL
jgi:hypothetical protein